MKKLFLAILCSFFFVACSSNRTEKESASQRQLRLDTTLVKKSLDEGKPVEKSEVEAVTPAKKYTHPVIKISTSKGDILAELYENRAPNTVANIITLAEKGYYKDMSFHRILRGFMAQGGCPNTKPGANGRPGTGGPGYTFDNEIDNDLRHNARGILSMANAGPNTNGSQFFICFRPTQMLDGGYTVFGKVIEGFSVIDKLEAAGSSRDPLPPSEKITFDITVVSKNNTLYKVIKN
jgi:peptidyl-prolyl cis-trans isomerase B (cyclophilin B)